jgi:riboflavin synthase
MFTGIIAQKGRLSARVDRDNDARLEFSVDGDFLDGCREGDSIAVSGVCLTALQPGNQRFSTDVSAETLDKTTLGSWKVGREVNLELSLRAGDRLGGHMVSGHVDGRCLLLSREPDGEAWRLIFELPAGLGRYVAVKGSICIDGISLTVNEVEDMAGMKSRCSVCIIPHTMAVTSLGDLQPGMEANFEVDTVARYLERIVSGKQAEGQ